MREERMEKNRLTVNILGVSITLSSKESPEYLKYLADFLQNKINDVRKNLVITEPLKVLIMAALNISDELFKERKAHHTYSEPVMDPVDFEEFANRMIDKIDASLIENQEESY
jgi:cell division protein ZapA (FtsZ GTPase activity inhibitor)